LATVACGNAFTIYAFFTAVACGNAFTVYTFLAVTACGNTFPIFAFFAVTALVNTFPIFALVATVFVAKGNAISTIPLLASTARYTYIIYAMFAFLTFRLT